MSTIKKTIVKKTITSKQKNGGKTFPDLNKDGKITKADVLVGKGVIKTKAKSGASMKKCKYGCK